MGRSDRTPTSGDNYAIISGGGMTNIGHPATVSRCTFSGNHSNAGGSANNGGGGFYNRSVFGADDTDSVFTDCDFDTNHANWGGGAVWSGGLTTVTFTGCTFDQNSANVTGGAVYLHGGGADVSNCEFTDNSSGSGGAIWGGVDTARVTAITDTTFTGNDSTTTTGAVGGGAIWSNENVDLLRCKFDSNTAQRHGGAIYVHDGIGNPTWEYVGCVFDSNTAENSGGAVYELNAAEAPIYLNSLFVLNEARGTAAGEGGGAIRNGGNSAVSYVNCTFVDNMATGGAGGGILGASNASPVVTNGIFWDNCDGSGCTTEDEDAQIQIQGSGNDDSVTHSTIEGCADPGFCEELSNKATEPTFVGSGAHPYQLQDVAANDNLIDGGDGENVSGDCLSVNTTTQDLTGGENTRFIRDDGMCGVETAVTVDMGAYEVQ